MKRLNEGNIPSFWMGTSCVSSFIESENGLGRDIKAHPGRVSLFILCIIGSPLWWTSSPSILCRKVHGPGPSKVSLTDYLLSQGIWTWNLPVTVIFWLPSSFLFESYHIHWGFKYENEISKGLANNFVLAVAGTYSVGQSRRNYLMYNPWIKVSF